MTLTEEFESGRRRETIDKFKETFALNNVDTAQFGWPKNNATNINYVIQWYSLRKE